MWDPSYNESFQDTERVEPPSIGATALNNASQEQIRFEDMAKGDMSEDDSCKSRSLRSEDGASTRAPSSGYPSTQMLRLFWPPHTWQEHAVPLLENCWDD